jgi:uncharacterized membrane-anchored protein
MLRTMTQPLAVMMALVSMISSFDQTSASSTKTITLILTAVSLLVLYSIWGSYVAFVWL